MCTVFNERINNFLMFASRFFYENPTFQLLPPPFIHSSVKNYIELRGLIRFLIQFLTLLRLLCLASSSSFMIAELSKIGDCTSSSVRIGGRGNSAEEPLEPPSSPAILACNSSSNPRTMMFKTPSTL
mmetsp:Transcript_18269/g.27062  ORF Transcript_18269/g.27062 Transcript_18269/m.27062 type:complete len:127 (-) Transcript_18269:1029-1409(-)